jgi:hypothetical protein
LTSGKLKVLSTPPDVCSLVEIEHRAPDNSVVTNVFYLKMLSRSEAKIEKCSLPPETGKCFPKIQDLKIPAVAGQKKSVVLYRQASIGKFFTECEGALFSLDGGPSWLLLQDFSLLEINAPNQVAAVGTYHFYLSIWSVTLTVVPPCSANYLEGLEQLGTVSLHLDERVLLHVYFEKDDKGQSWNLVCGRIQKTLLHNAPSFVRFFEDKKEIKVRPEDKSEVGLHLVLI